MWKIGFYHRPNFLPRRIPLSSGDNCFNIRIYGSSSTIVIQHKGFKLTQKPTVHDFERIILIIRTRCSTSYIPYTYTTGTITEGRGLDATLLHGIMPQGNRRDVVCSSVNRGRLPPASRLLPPRKDSPLLNYTGSRRKGRRGIKLERKRRTLLHGILLALPHLYKFISIPQMPPQPY